MFLFHIFLGLVLCNFLHEYLVSFKEKIWLDNKESTKALKNAQILLKDWRDCVQSFTTQIWTQSLINKWNGGPLNMNAEFNFLEELIEKVFKFF